MLGVGCFFLTGGVGKGIEERPVGGTGFRLGATEVEAEGGGEGVREAEGVIQGTGESERVLLVETALSTGGV